MARVSPRRSRLAPGVDVVDLPPPDDVRPEKSGPVAEERLSLPARRVLVVQESSALWGMGSAQEDAAYETARRELVGAYVWVLPPPGATDEEVARVAALVRAAGPAALHFEPRRRGRVVVEGAEEGPPAHTPHRSLREVALRLVDEANTRDRQALRDCVEGAMARVGL